MEFILAIVLIIVVALFASKSDRPTDFTNKLIIERKKCPPHQWFWQEVVDQNGIKQSERIVCKVCGPIASQSGREE